VKVAINGYGTIGKRVADAVAAQDDMEVVGVSKTRPSFEARFALQKGYPLYCAVKDNEGGFRRAGLELSGGIGDMLSSCDVVVDCTPGKFGANNKPVYEKAGVKAMWQGGEKHDLTGFSFSTLANYEKALGRDTARVVSCNTTGLSRVLSLLDGAYGVEKVRATMIRRATDPQDAKKGPIDAIVPDPVTLPSHHGPDLQTVLPQVNIVTLATKVPSTFMHLHVLNVELKENAGASAVRETMAREKRLWLVPTYSGITSTASLVEFARDMGRPRHDLWENCVWEESVNVVDGELFFFQGIHQESIVVPENVDCIRALFELEKDGRRCQEKTDGALGVGIWR